MRSIVAATVPWTCVLVAALLLVACDGGERTLDVGFYAYFAPVSHSADEAPGSPGFNTHRGYEADLLTALEAMNGVGLSFNRHAIAEWPGIWLKSAGDEFDIVGGGITILDSRTRNDDGDTLVAFTNGHIAFRQSLLVRTEDADQLSSHDSLTSDMRVGALAGTTGEARLLQLTGLADANGVLAAGTRLETASGLVTADGSADYVITAAGTSPVLEGRRHLHPPADTMPQVVYLGDELGERELLEALANGDIDALARGEIGNADAVQESGGAFVVTALDDAVEYGGFTVAAGDTDLLARLNERIDYLTDNRRIGYAEWLANPAVFMERAQRWPPVKVGFHPFYEPVSYNGSADPGAPGFNTHLGYEAALLTAVEAMDDGPAFQRRAIPEWPGVWLKSAEDGYDVIGGGITIQEARTRNAAGDPAVAFTNGHIAFRQSLLVRAEDAGRLTNHDRLTGDVLVGVSTNTTNESRLLLLTGLADDSGVLAAGTRVETDAGEVIADGSADYVITAAGSSPGLVSRRYLHPADDTMPRVVYLPDPVNDADLHRMLRDREVDAIAREEIDNSGAAHGSDGGLAVTALDSLVEYGGFTVDAGDTDLLALLNERIDYLTDNRRIGYAEWRADPAVFMQRAAQWRR